MKIEELKKELAEIEATLTTEEIKEFNDGRSRFLDFNPKFEKWSTLRLKIYRIENPATEAQSMAAYGRRATIKKSFRRH